MEHFGCLLSEIDVRDYTINSKNAQLPARFELPKYQKVKDQGNVGSCVAHALSSILEYHDRGQHKLSTNFIYGFQQSNISGMTLRDACDIAKKHGDMLESECPGNYERPNAHTYFQSYVNSSNINNGYHFRIASYYKCAVYKDIKYGIYKYGPVLATIKWPNNYKIDLQGNLIPTNKNEQFSYHAVVIYGWDETGFLCQNSWGKFWGKLGYFHIRYQDNLIAEARAIVDYDNPKDDALVAPTPVMPKYVYHLVNKVRNLFPYKLFKN